MRLRIFSEVHVTASFLFCGLLVLYPILNRYSSPVPQLTLSEFLLLGFFLHALLSRKLLGVKPIWSALVFSLYLVLHSFLDAANLSGALESDAIWSACRVAYIYTGIAIFAPLYFDERVATRWLNVVSVFVASYGLLQIAFSYAGIVLTSYIPFLPVIGDNLDLALEAKMSYGLRFRCQSLLNEPAALCCYLLLPVALSLFKRGSQSPNYKLASFLSVVALASASSTGLICVAILWISHFLVRLWMDRKNGGWLIVAFAALCIIGVGTVVVSGLWDYFVMRVFGGSGLTVSGLSRSTRFYAFKDTFGASETIYGILFGEGMYQTTNYLPGFFRLYLSLGLVGLTIMVVLLATRLHCGNHETRACTLLFIVLNVGTEILLGNFAFYYLAFILGMEVGGNGLSYSISSQDHP